ncbi:MAG: C39 family peptidase [Clostridiales Family XIII bacterium]|jgi:uncharacterized protein YvpB|nr:C39 family peptidase [Clostridiales Family XIII bacterium]
MGGAYSENGVKGAGSGKGKANPRGGGAGSGNSCAGPGKRAKRRCGGRIVIDAPFIDQREKYPTGCESVTAVMALNYAGVDIEPGEFIENYLEKGSMPHVAGGAVVGANPRKAFVGSPYSPNDNGCYSPVIKRAAEKVIADKAAGAYSVADAGGLSLGKLCAKYIRKGIPVLLWATMYMRHTFRGESWRDEDDASVRITWRNNEHCLLLVGYDKKYYYFNDPLIGAKTRFTKSRVKRAYRSMFRQALAILPEAK